ncbi:helix-turn-helix domain-containing protein [Thermaerobacillus caldiproteolyticus]|uniref:helix-turn-helix domain-containing protein n=1 Tax=Thermaerobacillus caldiproteolyticus TaxID=247480 RepID=UPI001F45565B|nr:helix-turn-helix domain-containing protein [Anoxybacillus caldiproteolyticus]
MKTETALSKKRITNSSSASTSKPELGITETSNSDGLNKSTVHRLMKTLEKEGFVLKEIKRRANISWGFHF